LFEDLPERLQRLLLGVVVYRDAFGLEMARGMLADVEVEDLRSLVDEGFLLVRGDRWLLHPLMGRLVGQALVEADQDRESHQKAIDYFMLHMKTEVSSIEDCTEHFEVFHHWCELGQYALADQIMDNCIEFLNRRGYYYELLLIYERLTKIWSIYRPDDAGEQQILGWAWGKLGWLYYSLGKYQTAINAYKQAQILFKDNLFNKAFPLVGLGTVHYSMGEYQNATSFYQQSLAVTQKIGDRNGEAVSFINLGNVYYSIGDCQMAIDFHQQSLFIEQEIGDRYGESLSCHNLSLFYQQRGQLRKSRSYRFQAYRIWQELQLPLAALPCSDFQKRMFQGSGEDWIEKLIQNEQKLAWLHDSIGLISFVIRWLFSPIRWIQK
jgi:tetratricopeptide (TPR) repeat protein